MHNTSNSHPYELVQANILRKIRNGHSHLKVEYPATDIYDCSLKRPVINGIIRQPLENLIVGVNYSHIDYNIN